MLTQGCANILRQGDIFRDWLIDIAGERISNKRCDIAVYKLFSSHTVCRYEFAGENYSVIGKFFSEPTGHKRDFDYYLAMRHEWGVLTRLQSVIDTARPLAAMKSFNCVLVTEYVKGSPFSVITDNDTELSNKVEAIGKVMRKIHSITQRYYDKDEDFHQFDMTLEDCKIETSLKRQFKLLLELWWESDLLNQDYGCTIHDDASPRNYLFQNQKCYAVDFESSRNHANAVTDIGIMCAELSKEFIEKKNDAILAEPYIHALIKGYSANDNEFGKIRATLGFFMSLGFLRIARFIYEAPYKSKLLQLALDSLRL